MSAPEVLGIIASLNGGFNGEVPGKQIEVAILSDTTARYRLRKWVNDAPTEDVEEYLLTLTPQTYTPPPPVEA